MISVLCVDDNKVAAGEIRSLIAEVVGADHLDFVVCKSVTEAKTAIESRLFDVAFIDVLLPMRNQEVPRVDGGLQVLDFIASSARAKKPRYVVGVTSEQARVAEAREKFERLLFALIERVAGDDSWKSVIGHFISYVHALQQDVSGIRTTLGIEPVSLVIVCAVADTELRAVRRWFCGSLKELSVPNDPSRYFVGKVNAPSGEHQIIAVAAPEQGMPVAAALVSKIIGIFRPRVVAMTGISAAMSEECGYGDVLVATQTWDHTTGKLKSGSGEQLTVLPENRSIRADAMIVGQFERLADDVSFLTKVRDEWDAEKPSTVLAVRLGPIASGGAVIESSEVRDGIKARDRKTIGIDMEAHGVAVACWHGIRPNPTFVVAKSVVDYGVVPKENKWHQYAAYTSARILAEWARRYL